MFEPSDKPRVFALPPGADFPAFLVKGLRDRFAGKPPAEMAQTELFLNTSRMGRRVKELFDQGPPCLLPRVRLVTDLGQDIAVSGLDPAISQIRRRLELSQLVARLIEQQPKIAPSSSIFGLADSLAVLLAEMEDEGVAPEIIRNLDVRDESEHWKRGLEFFKIVERFFGADSDEPLSIEARQRAVVELVVQDWKERPPSHPIIIAGSTGSRGPTALLMNAVARMPQGAIILPGYDLPEPVWNRFKEGDVSEDHPQFRFARLLEDLEIGPQDVQIWEDAEPPCPARNAVVSLALRPAPITHQWLVEGPELKNLDEAMRDVALVEAPSTRIEALSIAIILHDAALTGRKAALITPNRQLSRQVAAALDRWRIEPDDSGGHPLGQTPSGRLFRQIAQLSGTRLAPETLLALLKHPLVAAGSDNRAQHLDWTRDLEGWLRRYGSPFPDEADLLEWATKGDDDDGRQEWAQWIGGLVKDFPNVRTRHLQQHFEATLACARGLVSGWLEGGTDAPLWDTVNGREAARMATELGREASYGGMLSASDFYSFFVAILNRFEVRDPKLPHPDIMIWGTLEARVQGADLVILAGLNEGTWPEQSPPDPWLSRKMRADAGLRSPDRVLGLSAHDFQQAIGAKEVVLTRSVRDSDSETVASRWLNRITNLLDGISDESRAAINASRERGDGWVRRAHALEEVEPVEAAKRPSPRPPVSTRPTSLSVTEIKRLVTDPYSIYAKHILRVRPLDPLRKTPDALLRGTIVHDIMERFIAQWETATAQEHKARLMQIADEVLEKDAPWNSARRIWRAKLEKVADGFIAEEVGRKAKANTIALEPRGEWSLEEPEFKLVANIDRIDRTESGGLVIYDYKTGVAPTEPVQKSRDQQLYLEAVIAEFGSIEGLTRGKVERVTYIGMGSSPGAKDFDLDDGKTRETADRFAELIAAYANQSLGYTSLRQIVDKRHSGDYDHLARFKEWSESDKPDSDGWPE